MTEDPQSHMWWVLGWQCCVCPKLRALNGPVLPPDHCVSGYGNSGVISLSLSHQMVSGSLRADWGKSPSITPALHFQSTTAWKWSAVYQPGTITVPRESPTGKLVHLLNCAVLSATKRAMIMGRLVVVGGGGGGGGGGLWTISHRRWYNSGRWLVDGITLVVT